ncbi:hypothetical protein [Ureaplasma ceti]|uniref:Uncharacterized protein n=1 Tax=Ureaplasma ceti TaxID=3119530 RepID=A0ABP9U7W1_9BACT
MGKTVIISNKTYNNMSEVGLNYCHDDGNVYTADRLYGTINETLNYQIKAKNRILGFLVSFLFQTTDYKKNKKLSNIKMSKGDILLTLFFWACIIALICCIIWGIAIPIINSSVQSIKLAEGTFTGSVLANNHVVGFVFNGKLAAATINQLMEAVNKNGDLTASGAAAGVKSLPWAQAYLEQWWVNHATTGYSKDALGMVEFLKNQVLGQMGKATATVVLLDKNLQVFMYFNIVAKTLDPKQGVPVFDTAKMMFNGLNQGNPYYGLEATSFSLTSNQATQALLVPRIWIAWFSSGKVIVPLIFTLLLIIIVAMYRHLIKKVRPRMNAMGIADYVMAKVVFSKRLRLLLRKPVPMVEGVKELNHRFLFAAPELGVGGIYFNLRLLNYMYATFREMNVVLVFPFGDNDAGIAELQKIVAQDFQNLDLTIVDDELAAKFSSLDSSGNFFRFGGKAMNQDVTEISVVDAQTPKDMARTIYSSELAVRLRIKDESRVNRIRRASLKEGLKFGGVNHNLNENEKAEITKKVQEQVAQSDSDFIQKQLAMIQQMKNDSVLGHITNTFKNNKPSEK